MNKIELEDSLIKDIESRKSSIQEALLNWGAKHYRNFLWREKRTPYSVLISEVLLKRTTASAATHVYEKVMTLYPNIQTLSKAYRKELETLLSRIGYHKRRSEILIEMADYILTEYNGEIPRSKQALLDIPHVGNYTANAVLSFGYGVPAAIVDSNVERLINRIFHGNLHKKTNMKSIQKIADRLLPSQAHQAFNYALLDFGASVCKYGIPRCPVCPITSFCDYFSSLR